MSGFTAEYLSTPVPVLTIGGREPRGGDLRALERAVEASGYQGRVRFVQALPGSPEPILAIGAMPSWLTKFAYIDNTNNIDRLAEALRGVLVYENDPRLGDPEWLLSKWMGCQVEYKGEETHV